MHIHTFTDLFLSSFSFSDFEFLTQLLVCGLHWLAINGRFQMEGMSIDWMVPVWLMVSVCACHSLLLYNCAIYSEHLSCSYFLYVSGASPDRILKKPKCVNKIAALLDQEASKEVSSFCIITVLCVFSTFA
jgi:hypothetical protein